MGEELQAAKPDVPERRRSPRVAVSPGSWLTAPSSWPVALLDLSLGGLSFSSPHGFEAGRRASVRATLGGDAFTGSIRVCWIRPRGAVSAGDSRFEVGAEFLPLDDSSRCALQTFLRLSPPSENIHAD